MNTISVSFCRIRGSLFVLLSVWRRSNLRRWETSSERIAETGTRGRARGVGKRESCTKQPVPISEFSRKWWLWTNCFRHSNRQVRNNMWTLNAFFVLTCNSFYRLTLLKSLDRRIPILDKIALFIAKHWKNCRLPIWIKFAKRIVFLYNT